MSETDSVASTVVAVQRGAWASVCFALALRWFRWR